MARICQCRCSKEECVQCGVNVGYAIGRFMQDARVIDGSKIGTLTDDGKVIYTGIIEVDNGGVCDVAFPIEKTKFRGDKFIPELSLQNGAKGNMSDYLEQYIKENGGGEYAMQNLKMFEQGKMFVSPFKVGTKITPRKKEEVNHETKCKIQSIKFTVQEDAFGNFRQVMQIGTNCTVKDGQKIFTPSEFLENFSVNGATTKSGSEFIKMTDGGIIRPVCIRYGGLSILIDNCYIYIDDGSKTVPVGTWGAYDTQRSESLDLILNNKNFKKVKDAIESLSKLHKYIAPYWCASSNIIIAEK